MKNRLDMEKSSVNLVYDFTWLQAAFNQSVQKVNLTWSLGPVILFIQNNFAKD